MTGRARFPVQQGSKCKGLGSHEELCAVQSQSPDSFERLKLPVGREGDASTYIFSTLQCSLLMLLVKEAVGSSSCLL